MLGLVPWLAGKCGQLCCRGGLKWVGRGISRNRLDDAGDGTNGGYAHSMGHELRTTHTLLRNRANRWGMALAKLGGGIHNTALVP